MSSTINNFNHLQPYKIVGLDLTGSEKKPSGTAVLSNGTASTMMLKSNAEIIEMVCKIVPDLIAIDSPLSLPAGRISVYDDDPGRATYGINRQCEKLLLKKGIRSYPPLIKSMQQLTLRGITLAKILRDKGFRVIETYPGAVQDILGLPRKQKDLILLRDGIKKFGISGTFTADKSTHDEIDALTCCIAGLYFLSESYEALGNETEGYLIIPNEKSTLL